MAFISTSLKKRVRSFLTEAGASPHAGLTRNYEQIYIAMQRRREDDAFWSRLTELVQELVYSVVNTKAPQASLPPEAKFLALWDVGELAQLLRAALPHGSEPGPGTQARFLRGLSPNGLGLCLLLSLAASACGSSGSESSGNNATSAGGTIATGGVSAQLATGGTAPQGGGTTAVASGGSPHTGGTSAVGEGGTSAGATGGALGEGGAAFGGTATSGGESAQLASGGTTESGGTGGTVTGSTPAGGSINTGGSFHSGGTQAVGSTGGTIALVTGGTVSTGGSQYAGGSLAVSGTGGSTANTGGSNGTGGTLFSCTKPGGAAGATAVGDHPLPASCCVDTASALWRAIDDSTLDATQKQQLYTCFVNLNVTWCDGLVDLFKTATPQVIAQSLTELLTCCQYVPGKLSGDFGLVRQDVVNRMLCSVALYKGVTFPS